MKELQPLLKKTLAAYETIKDLSIDDLRHKTVEFREKIRTATQAEEDRLAELRTYLETNYDIPVEEKENTYKEIEKLEEKIYSTTQDILNEIQPEAFAVMKETARRFKDNETITVTATQHDRDLAAKRESVTIEGDKAIY
ncbi:MAG: preprotein translocase subunit SecA, partial [Bacteroidales bacterium]|nr:preprotein translocase subunit SecA [Bacteroidales bacterium]